MPFLRRWYHFPPSSQLPRLQNTDTYIIRVRLFANRNILSMRKQVFCHDKVFNLWRRLPNLLMRYSIRWVPAIGRYLLTLLHSVGVIEGRWHVNGHCLVLMRQWAAALDLTGDCARQLFYLRSFTAVHFMHCMSCVFSIRINFNLHSYVHVMDLPSFNQVNVKYT